MKISLFVSSYLFLLIVVVIFPVAPSAFASSVDSLPNLDVYGLGVIRGDISQGISSIHPGSMKFTTSFGNRLTQIGTEEPFASSGSVTTYRAGSNVPLVDISQAYSDNAGTIWTYGDSSANVFMGNIQGTSDQGMIQLYSAENVPKAELYTTSSETGVFNIYGPNQARNYSLNWSSSGANYGWMGLYDDNGGIATSLYSSTHGGALFIANQFGSGRVYSYVASDNCGRTFVYGQNGSTNVGLGTSISKNHGWLGIYNESGNSVAAMYIDSDSNSVISANIKNFHMPDPNDENREIWYACIEGPEAGAYDRGTATLVNGEVFIPYSDHFQSVINSSTVTVILTPHSSETYGLAVVEKSNTGFNVKELMGGKGSFSFDWEVKGVRDGYEDYKVYRPKGEMNQPGGSESIRSDSGINAVLD